MTDYTVKGSTNDELKEKVVQHRERFKNLFKARYMEMLPSLIKYKNAQTVSVDFMKVELALRNNYDVVIGETADFERRIQVIGYATSNLSTGNPADLFSTKPLSGAAINFVIPEHLRLKEYTEITYNDSCKTGNFVILRNKNFNYGSDLTILNHYIDELAEIQLSRYSISMQVKIQTLFIGEPGDETINEMVNDLYNGAPFSKVSKMFDKEDQIHQLQNEGLASVFKELKDEYQNKISELNNMLGMNSLAVEKESGVSDTEAQSNRAYTSGNANIYLDGRNNGLLKLNKRYNLALEALYNDEVVSEMQELAKKQEAEGGGSGNDNHPV